jgi:bifunctional non-homologous end joining protein LigD
MRPFGRLYGPMLAELCEDPTVLKSDQYIYEPKLDGERVVAYYEDGELALVNRNFKNIVDRFPEVRNQLMFQQDFNFVADGELVCEDGKLGTFQYIQKRMTRKYQIEEYAAKYPARFTAFDLLEYKSDQIWSTPTLHRKAFLSEVARGDETEWHIGAGSNYGVHYLTELAAEGWEGVMAKHFQTPYRVGRRHKDWLKLKARKIAVVTICGLLYGIGRRAPTFGALLVCDADNRIIGEVGTGYSDVELVQIRRACDELRGQNIKTQRWHGFAVQPVLKAKVSYIETTEDGQLRHPAFLELVHD